MRNKTSATPKDGLEACSGWSTLLFAVRFAVCEEAEQDCDQFNIIVNLNVPAKLSDSNR
ncbi:hypothetical protein [Sporolactobacillus pectinivorans]|uniref:hypothetical protein n=1 Tax=Sporolactobacillus pectinivorans TaxID=1591408 RepID=UPI0012FDA540|nr:hypothetical protein [Sporolactobacillus pectinivorans]